MTWGLRPQGPRSGPNDFVIGRPEAVVSPASSVWPRVDGAQLMAAQVVRPMAARLWRFGGLRPPYEVNFVNFYQLRWEVVGEVVHFVQLASSRMPAQARAWVNHRLRRSSR